MRTIIMVFGLLIFHSCTKATDLTTVPKVDINRYLGQWHEIARFPNRFEKGLECVTANYSLKKNGKIEVLNKGFRSNDPSKAETAKGSAWVPDKNFPGRLKVTFFWPFAGNYYIIALDENYRYALVGDPSREYLWILAREKELDETIYQHLVDIARQNGFDPNKLEKIAQDCKQ